MLVYVRIGKDGMVALEGGLHTGAWVQPSGGPVLYYPILSYCTPVLTYPILSLPPKGGDDGGDGITFLQPPAQFPTHAGAKYACLGFPQFDYCHSN